MKRLLGFILVLASLLSLFSCTAYAHEPEPYANFDESGQALISGPGVSVQESEAPADSEEPADPNEFRKDLFADVMESDWFFDAVKNAYERGIMEGRKKDTFAPLDSVTLAETVTMAARLRSGCVGDSPDFSGGDPWYAPAVDYAAAQGIIRDGDFDDYTAPATRAQFAYILSGALPSGALEEINTVEDNSLPDVRMDSAYAENIYLLYRAGILSGQDERGTFSPSGAVTRAEAAAVTSRIADAPLRVECAFYAPVYPDLSLRARADDSFFADTAFLGNSLVEGLRLYSKLKVDYYSGTSMSIYSALHTKNVRLNNGAKGTQIDAMAQKQYGKIYIELGINEMGSKLSTNISRYRTLLDKIRATQPNAEIYVMAVTPTSRSKIGTSFSRDRIVADNNALYNLAAEWGCYYLDDFTPLADSEGYLPSSQTWDGVHFTAAKYKVWEELIRTYYA